MMTAIDTNVILALWDPEDSLHRPARAALDEVQRRGGLVICGPVYGELLAGPGRTEEFVDQFCEETQIGIEWEIGEKIWRAAGVAFQNYVVRRKRDGRAGARRILTDFVIGAHALVNGCKLLTLDAGWYRASLPRLEIVST
jgi:predicted nucleic acid-binding protein